MNFLDYNSDSDSDIDDHVIEFNHGTSSTIVITPGVSSNSNIIPPSVSGSGVSSLLGSSSSQPYSSQLSIGNGSAAQRIDPSSLVSSSQSHHPQPPQPQAQPQPQPQPGLSLAELASIAAAKRAKEQEEENKKKEQSNLVSVSASLLSMYNDEDDDGDDDDDHDQDGQDSNDESTENTLDMDGNPPTPTQKHKRAKTTGALSSDGSDGALVQLDSTTTTSITNDNNNTHNDSNSTNNSNDHTTSRHQEQQPEQQQQQKKRRKTRTRLEDEFKNANIIRITHNDLTQRTKEEEIYAELHRKFNIGHHQKHIQSTMWDGVHGKEVVVDKASDAAKRKNQITVAAAKAERIQRDREFQRAYSQAIKRLHYEEQLKKSSSSSSL